MRRLVRALFGGRDDDGSRGERPTTSPEELAARWERLVEAGEEAIERSDVASLAQTVESAAAVREELDGMRNLWARIETPRLPGGSRLEVAYALGDLGAWGEAVRVARETTAPLERQKALRWLALRAPLGVLRDGAWTALVREAPVRWVFLARLGRESRAARRVALRALDS